MAGAIQYESGVDMATEASYPYKAADGTCKTSGISVGIAKGGITGYKSVGNFLFRASVNDMTSITASADVAGHSPALTAVMDLVRLLLTHWWLQERRQFPSRSQRH